MQDPPAPWDTSAATSGIHQSPQAACSRRSRTQKKTTKVRDAKQRAKYQAFSEEAVAQERGRQEAADHVRLLSFKKNLCIASCLSALVLVCILSRGGGGGGSGGNSGEQTGVPGVSAIVCACPLLLLTCKISGCGVLPMYYLKPPCPTRHV